MYLESFHLFSEPESVQLALFFEKQEKIRICCLPDGVCGYKQVNEQEEGRQENVTIIPSAGEH